MKRFQSNLQKVHALCHQKCRLAELELLRQKSLWDKAKRDETDARRQRDHAQQSAADALRRRTPGIVVQGAQHGVDLAETQLQQARRRTAEAQEGFAKARRIYEAHKAQAERISKLIERQRADYRKDVFRQQQIAMDEVSAARWTGVPETLSEVMSHG